MPQREIAETHGVSQRTIGRWMKEDGVATRVRIEACRTERSKKKVSNSKKGENHPFFGKRGMASYLVMRVAKITLFTIAI